VRSTTTQHAPESRRIATADAGIHILQAGAGPPVLFLHGFPETLAMWRRVVPLLADRHTCVCADLRGYGSSDKPPSTPDHRPYSKVEMARDMIQVMDELGFDRFSVVGHDRGGRVGFRLALDHPGRVERLVVLDVVPTLEAFERADARFALAFWPWSLLAQPEPLPENLLAGNPEAVVEHALREWGTERDVFPDAIVAAYVSGLRDSSTIHAICEEYRAAATIDLEHDRADRAAGRQVSCPVLVLWAAGGPLDEWYEAAGGPVGIWRTWAPAAEGRAISGGHFFAESNPVETVAALNAFLTEL
jgi:haloacetate dehalogenase